jgi:methionyl-tRNA synthetase
MAAKKTFYITTAIDYVNAEPHIGHAYQKIVADVLARWNALQGKEVFFLTGTDEHGKKIQNAAEKAGKSPLEFSNEMAKKFESAWKKLNIHPDRFIRTTDKDHEKTVSEFVNKINKSKDIYKGTYEGYYCTPCENYYTEKDLINGCCPVHKTKIELLKEESYFFKLSKYQKFLLELYKKNPEFILPEARRNEIINRVKEGLNDLSITRTSFSWGVPFPLDKKHVVYVWFDALINYYTAVNSPKLKKFWPADVHILGKDNGWFHAVIWPAMLKSAGIELPKTVFIHGFLTFNGEKISKSLGNVISPIVLVDKYGADSIRYFVCRQFPFAEGNDGDFSEKDLVRRHNDELANKLGNLVSRVSGLIETNGTEKTTNNLIKKLKLKEIENLMETYQLDKALNEIFAFVDVCNEYVQSQKPWETKNKKVLFELKESILKIAGLLSPFIPESAEKITKCFSSKQIKKAEPLFKKIEIAEEDKSKDIKKEKTTKIEGIANMSDIVKYEDFSKLDLRVATIKKVEDIEGADKLYKLEVEIGKEKRTIVAGIKEYYKKDELKAKQVIVICNLEPRKMKGIESKGMLLAAVSEDHSKVILLSPEKKIDSGAKVS